MNKYSYTVKEIADILGVSKTAIQKYIKSYNIDYDYIDKNKYFYGKEKTIAIIKGIRSDFNISEIDKATQKSDNRKPTTENQQPPTDNRQSQTSAVCDTEPKEKECEIGREQQPQTDNRQSQTDNRQPTTADNEEVLRQMINILEKQLEENRKQLDVKDKQIQDLSDRLEQALQLTAGQQFIHAVDKKEMITDNSIDTMNESNIKNVSDNIVEEVIKEEGFIKKLRNLFR
jgi:DNA-binding transcriptional MerR regulator